MKYIHKKKNNMAQLVGFVEVALLVLIVTIVTATFYMKESNKAIQNEVIELKEKVIDRTSMTEAESNALMSTLAVIDEVEEREVIFSNYSIDDESGVNESGALGIGITDFKTNSKGWYEYQGKVALACAMEHRGDVREGYRHWEPLEELVFNFEGNDCQGICVDTGLAMLGWKNETEQRIDIWVSDLTANFGLVKGIVYE